MEYTLHPLGYIPLDISTLLVAIANKAHGGVSVGASRGRVVASPRRSVTTTSSYHSPRYLEIQVAIRDRSIGI